MSRSTFRMLSYANGSKEKNGIVPLMGRVTINETVAQFSCKQTIPKELWDAKGNKTKGKGKEARKINLALDDGMDISNWFKLKQKEFLNSPGINPKNKRGIKM